MSAAKPKGAEGRKQQVILLAAIPAKVEDAMDLDEVKEAVAASCLRHEDCGQGYVRVGINKIRTILDAGVANDEVRKKAVEKNRVIYWRVSPVSNWTE